MLWGELAVECLYRNGWQFPGSTVKRKMLLRHVQAIQPGWEMSELFCSNRACARGSGTKSWCIWLPISKQAVQQLRTVQIEEKSIVDSVKTWPVTKMNQMDVLELEEERIQRIHPLHLIIDCCSAEGTGLFCLADLGRARMNRLKLRGIRGCFLRLFKG